MAKAKRRAAVSAAIADAASMSPTFLNRCDAGNDIALLGRCGRPFLPHCHTTAPLQEMAMDTTSKLRALGLALTLVATAAGTGWALQVPLTATMAVSPAQALRITPPAEAPGLSFPAWPHPAAQRDDDTSARGRAGGAEEIDGLEE
jgi:hypothetical protein